MTAPAAATLASLLDRVRQRLTNSDAGNAVVSGAVKVFAITAAGYALGFVLQFILARALGHDSYGRYAYVLGWMNVVVIGAKLESDTLAMRLVSEYAAKDRTSTLRGLLAFAHRLVLRCSTVLAIIATLVLLLVKIPAVAEIRGPGLAAALLLPITALLALEAGILQGYKRPVHSQLPNSIIRPAIAIAIMGALFLLLPRPMSATYGVLANTVACAIALAIAARWRRRAFHTIRETPEDLSEQPVWNRTIRGLLAVSLAQMVLSTQTDVVIVGTFANPAAAGGYALASQLCSLIFFGASAVVFMSAPVIAELNAKGDRVELQRMVFLIGRVNVLLTLPIFLVLAAVGGWLLGQFSPEFRTAYPILLLLGAGTVLGGAFGALQGFLLTMTGHEQAAARIVGISAISYLVAALVLTPLYGALGTAVATTIGYALRAVLLNTYIWRTLRINAMLAGPLPRPMP